MARGPSRLMGHTNSSVDSTTTAPADFDAWNEVFIRDALRDVNPILYDLKTDPGEEHDVVEEHPAIADRFDVLLERPRTTECGSSQTLTLESSPKMGHGNDLP